MTTFHQTKWCSNLLFCWWLCCFEEDYCIFSLTPIHTSRTPMIKLHGFSKDFRLWEKGVITFFFKSIWISGLPNTFFLTGRAVWSMETGRLWLKFQIFCWTSPSTVPFLINYNTMCIPLLSHLLTLLASLLNSIDPVIWLTTKCLQN